MPSPRASFVSTCRDAMMTVAAAVFALVVAVLLAVAFTATVLWAAAAATGSGVLGRLRRLWLRRGTPF